MRPPVFLTLRRSKILAHRFVYPTDAEPDLDFPASVPSWDCGVESRSRPSGCLFWWEKLKDAFKGRTKSEH